jgi:hypothetical protein
VRGRNDAPGRTLEHAQGGIDRANAEPDRDDVESTERETPDDGRREKRQLLHPDGGGGLHREHPAVEPDGARAIRDPRADGLLPFF